MQKTHAWIPPALLLAVSGLLSRILGVFRDHLLAKTFGASAGAGLFDLDTYYAAFRFPDLVYNLLVMGAVSAAFIPLFTQYKKEGELKKAWEFASSMMHILTLGVLGLSILIFFFAIPLAHAVAPGFSEAQILVTAKLMRIMALSPVLFSVAAILISIQDSFKHFFFRSLAPLFYNVGIIASIWFWGPKYGVIGVTWGVILGALLQLLVQLPALWEIGYKHQWLMGWKRPDVREGFRLMGPRVLGLSINQLVGFVSTLITSFLATGSITIYYLAINLQAVPLGIISVSFAITTFATLAELASEPSKEPFAKEIQKIMGKVLFYVIPATLGILVLKDEIIRTIFRYGKFSDADAALITGVLAILMTAAFAQSLIAILIRGFYSFHDTKTPLQTGFLSALVTIGGSLLLGLKLKWGVLGIAAAFSFGDNLNFILMYGKMRQRIGHPLFCGKDILKMGISALVMTGVVYAAKTAVPFDGSAWNRLVIVGLLSLLGVVTYFGLGRLMGLEEAKRWPRIRPANSQN